MELLTEEIYDTRMSVNDKIKVGDMNEAAKSFYFMIYALYMDFLYKYLIKKTDIKKYDNELKTSLFPPVHSEEMDFYQMFSKRFLKFFYIRNNLYFDRLTKDDIEFLNGKLRKQEDELSLETENFIERTYKQLIFENVSGDYDSNFVLNFGPDAPRFYSPVNSFVIGVRYHEEAIDGRNEDSIKQYLIKREKVESMIPEISQELTKVLSMPVSVIYYDNNSVKKKNNVTDEYKR